MTNPHDDDVKSENIKHLLLLCGVSDKTQGFGFLANAVLLSLSERRRKISDIYSEIGDAIGYPETKVHRYVDYSINHARKLCDTINRILGTEYASFRLKNKLVVSLLTMCYCRLYLSDIQHSAKPVSTAAENGSKSESLEYIFKTLLTTYIRYVILFICEFLYKRQIQHYEKIQSKRFLICARAIARLQSGMDRYKTGA